MKDRLFQILRWLSYDDPLFFKLASVEEFDEGVFEIAIVPNPPDPEVDNWFSEHRTFLRYEVFGDEKVWVRIEHIWGWFDTDMDCDELVTQMITAFKENTRSWHVSGFYLGMREHDGTNLLTLNSSDNFFTKWNDEDIKELIRQRIFGLGAAFMAHDPSLTAFRNNYEGE